MAKRQIPKRTFPVVAGGGYLIKERDTNIITDVDKPILDRSVQDLASLTRTPPTMYNPIIAMGGNEPTFLEPTIQQQKVLVAMEAQKQAEKDQARKNNAWQLQQDSMQRKIQSMEAERQRTQEFKNRTKEEILQNFIRTQTQKELAGQFDNPQVPTNFNQYLAERGFDVTRPETIPTTIFRPTTLDSEEKLRESGVAESIIRDMKPRESYNPYPIPFDKGINWNGITETPSIKVAIAERQTASSILFTPPHDSNINEPIGRSTPLAPSITTTGLAPTRSTNVSDNLETKKPMSSPVMGLLLLASAFII
jgi:hypothetical protein